MKQPFSTGLFSSFIHFICILSLQFNSFNVSLNARVLIVLCVQGTHAKVVNLISLGHTTYIKVE